VQNSEQRLTLEPVRTSIKSRIAFPKPTVLGGVAAKVHEVDQAGKSIQLCRITKISNNNNNNRHEHHPDVNM